MNNFEQSRSKCVVKTVKVLHTTTHRVTLAIKNNVGPAQNPPVKMEIKSTHSQSGATVMQFLYRRAAPFCNFY